VILDTPPAPGCNQPNDGPEWSTFYAKIEPAFVKFTRPDSAVVYPYYPAIQNDTVTVGPKKRFLDLELKVMLSDSTPVPNAWVRIDKPLLVDSGGHSHDGNRPMGKYSYPIGSANRSDTLKARTDSTGKLKFRYFASQFGGVERIRARLVSDTTKFDTLSLRTRVPGLVLLPENTNYYLKTGGRSEHHGPPGFSEDNNHWITPVARDSLISGAIKFRNARWNRQGEKMKINDISLPYGGGLDIFGAWTADVDSPACYSRGHCSHRTGTDVDIENLSRLKKLIEAFENKGWTYKKEPQPTRFPHFRFK
jgi:hypothetical protein